MKKTLFFLFLPLTLTIQSCGGESGQSGDGNDSTKTEVIDYTGMKSFDLNPFGLKTSLMVTEEISSTGSPFPVEVIQDEDMLTWDVIAGPGYHIIIEEVDGEGNYIAREKERLANDVVFKEEFLKDEPTMFMYRATLPDGAGQRDYHHVFGLVKIGNIEYLVKSDPFGEYSEVQATDMYKSIKSIEQNQNPS